MNDLKGSAVEPGLYIMTDWLALNIGFESKLTELRDIIINLIVFITKKPSNIQFNSVATGT